MTRRRNRGTVLRAACPAHSPRPVRAPRTVAAHRATSCADFSRKPSAFAVASTQARFSRPAAASPRRVSNRQSLTRLKNAATCRKQTPEANSNRHNRDGRHVWSRHHRNGFAAPAPARISCHVSSRAACLALNSTPYTSRSKIHPNSLKTIAGAHFYYEQMNQTVCATESGSLGALTLMKKGKRSLRSSTFCADVSRKLRSLPSRFAAGRSAPNEPCALPFPIFEIARGNPEDAVHDEQGHHQRDDRNDVPAHIAFPGHVRNGPDVEEDERHFLGHHRAKFKHGRQHDTRGGKHFPPRTALACGAITPSGRADDNETRTRYGGSRRRGKSGFVI